MTLEEMKTLPKEEQEKLFKKLKLIRHTAKTVNYSSTYGAYPPKIARTANISIEEARVLWETYWKRNWSIKKVAESISVQEVDWQGEKEMWLHNPVNGFWYSLRNEKDIFSTLNQGTGAYVFDVWIGFVLSKRKQLTAQFHDEGVWQVRKGHRKEFEELLLESIKETNQYLKLNRQLDIGIHWGNNYGDIH